MSDLLETARPYARAAFEFALEHDQIEQWSSMLQDLALVISDEQMSSVLDNPKVSRQQEGEIVLQICQDLLSEHAQNLVKLLATRKRLAVLPEIAWQFAQYRKEHERKIEVSVVSAMPINDTDRADLVVALERRFQRNIEVQYDVDSSLIGGAIIRADDLVIDGSTRNQLSKMMDVLSV